MKGDTHPTSVRTDFIMFNAGSGVGGMDDQGWQRKEEEAYPGCVSGRTGGSEGSEGQELRSRSGTRVEGDERGGGRGRERRRNHSQRRRSRAGRGRKRQQAQVGGMKVIYGNVQGKVGL